MDEVRFPLFIEKKGGMRESRSVWLFGLLMGSLLALWANQKYFNLDWIESIFYPVVWLAFLTWFFFIFYSQNEMEKLTGDFSGLLIFRKRSIKVVDDEIDLDEI